jgi:hypothetical protein
MKTTNSQAREVGQSFWIVRARSLHSIPAANGEDWSQANDPANEGQYYEPYFQILNASGDSHKLIEFVESRWSELADLVTDFAFESDFMGYAPLNETGSANHQGGKNRIQS